jgi:hypothetical protein
MRLRCTVRPSRDGFWVGAATLVALSGCTAPRGNFSGDAPISVSAVNYSRLSAREVYSQVNGKPSISPAVPAATRAPKPLFYLIVPGEIFPSDVTLPVIYHGLGVSLEQRGYYSALAQAKAGRPFQLDYLLRIHCGVRPWLNPIVRADRVTWGNDGLVAKRYRTHLVGDLNFDPRQGLSLEERDRVSRLAMTLMETSKDPMAANASADINTFVQDERAGGPTPLAEEFCLVVVEAFRFSDVKALDEKAPCAWMIFIAVPTDQRRKFSDVLAAMLKSAVPYYGETTQGPQVFEVPVGKVILGTPTEVKEKPVSPVNSPALNFH